MANKPEFDPHKSANLLATINANVDNDKLSDADFRQFIRNSIPVAIITEQVVVMINCPVCEGTKLNPYGGRGVCKCCNGVGEISEKTKEILAQISSDLKRKLAEREKANCDYSVYHIPSGNTRYETFNSSQHPDFSFDGRVRSAKSLQLTAEYLIETWNTQSPDHKYTLERMWWNGER